MAQLGAWIKEEKNYGKKDIIEVNDMKKIILLVTAILVAPFILADYGHMEGYGMMGGVGIGLYGIISFVLATFIFSIIFWSTYKWITKDTKKLQRNR